MSDDPMTLVREVERTAYQAGRNAERARVRAAILDVIDAGNAATVPGSKWVFLREESDDETATRVRFVDQVCKRLEELG